MPNKPKKSLHQLHFSVSCPNCGQLTDFSYVGILPDAHELQCPNCQSDIKEQYLKVLLLEQLAEQKTSQKKLFLMLLLNVFIAAFLLIYIFNKQEHWIFIVILFLLNLLVLTIVLHFFLTNRRSIKKIEDLQREFHLK